MIMPMMRRMTFVPPRPMSLVLLLLFLFPVLCRGGRKRKWEGIRQTNESRVLMKVY